MASWTAVSVRERGRFCVWDVRERLLRLGRGRIRREAKIKTCLSLNFFSSSRVRLPFVSWDLLLSCRGEERGRNHTVAAPCGSLEGMERGRR
jgi:hypothetical protein